MMSLMIIRVRKTTKSPEDYKESGRLQRVRKATRIRKTTRNIKNNKTMKDRGNQKIQEACKSQEVRKSQRRLPSLKNPESQGSKEESMVKVAPASDDSSSAKLHPWPRP